MNSAHQIYRYLTVPSEWDDVRVTFIALVGPALLAPMFGVLLAISRHLALSGPV